jgi:ubiquinone/menaquinone biosynthesis C-methylase UbiE
MANTAGESSHQVAWSAGDFAAIGSATLLTAELLAEALGVRFGWRVLDVAAGHGNMSLAMARRGCRVLSTDFVPALLERGRMRAEAEGFRINFEVADAEHLPYADADYDCVVSTFGVMFAPDQGRAAAELTRVCRAGGRIGLLNWTPASFIAQTFAAMARYVTPPAGSMPAALWGTPERLQELFPGVAGMHLVTRSAMMRAPSERAWLDRFRTYFGPLKSTFLALDDAGQAALEADLMELARERNVGTDGTMMVGSEYLEVVITR